MNETSKLQKSHLKGQNCSLVLNEIISLFTYNVGNLTYDTLKVFHIDNKCRPHPQRYKTHSSM